MTEVGGEPGRWRARLRILLVASAAVVSIPAGASADGKADCLSAFERAQPLRAQGQLILARAAFITCSHESCPLVVRRECSEGVVEVSREQPSLVVLARDVRGKDVAPVSLSIDGREVQVEPGLPLTVDPGKRTLRLSRSGFEPVSLDVVVALGEHHRTILVTMPDAVTSERRPREPHDPRDDAGRAPADPPRAGRSPWPIVLLGLGLTGLGASAFFVVRGLDRRDDLMDRCAPACDADAIGKIKTDYAIADVALGVGVVALAGAAYLFLTDRARPLPTATSGR